MIGRLHFGRNIGGEVLWPGCLRRHHHARMSTTIAHGISNDPANLRIEERGPPSEVFNNPRSERFRQFLAGNLK